MRLGARPRYPMPMKRFTLALAAILLPFASRFAAAQSVPIEVRPPVVPMPMPGGILPKLPLPAPIPVPNMPTRPFPIPALPGPLPSHFEYLPNFGTVVPGLPLPDAGIPGRVELVARREAKAGNVASAVARKPAAARFEATLAILRDTFGLNEEGQLKPGGKAEGTSAAFDGAQARPVARGRVGIPEQDLERDLGVK